MAAIRTLILGTAGHIDHGKSSLVRALTGVDPDRLLEEQQRGMTIDLGFAPYRLASGALVGIIDVPGHERFIKNMVAGATSVDVVMLVVAADDGVMPQTREHLQILQLLGVRRGLLVLTKIDLADAATADIARADAAELVRATFLEDAPVLPVSTLTGAGLPELKAALEALLAEVPPHGDEGPFRLPVQRVFSAPGHGTVVTGVPVSGRVAAGDALEVVGRDRALRVRGVQAYGAARAEGRAGHSTALNVTGATRADVRRGDVVATPGVFTARRRLSVHYRHVHDEPLRNNAAVRLHVGTAEVLGQAVVLEADSVAPAAESFLQLRLDEPVATAPGDRFLLRHAASMAVLGGGLVLAATDGRLKRFKERVLHEARERLAAQGDPLRLARVALDAAGRRGLTLAALALETGLPAETLRARLEPLLHEGELVLAGSLCVEAGALHDVADELLDAVAAEHKRHPLLDWADLAAVRGALEAPDELLAAILARDGRLETAPGGRVRVRGHHAQLSDTQSALVARVLAALEQGGAMPPPIDAAFTGLPEPATRALLGRLRAEGQVVAVGPLLFHPAVLARLREATLAHGRARGGAIDIPALRNELATTRKFLIPLLEHFDAEGLTVRHGERRTLRRV